MSKISEIIKQLRAEPLSLSQTEIEKRTGIPQSRISRWGSGEVGTGADDALKLSELLNRLKQVKRKRATA